MENILLPFYRIPNNRFVTPGNIFLSVDGHLDQFNSGVGVVFESNVRGLTKESIFNLNYNYQLKLNEGSQLLMGVGIKRLAFISSLNLKNPADPALFSIHDAIFDFDLGVAYQLNDLTLGTSIVNTLQSEFFAQEMPMNRKNNRIINNYLSYHYKVNKNLLLEPAVFVSILDRDRYNYEFNLMSRLFQYFTLGGNIRFSNYADEDISIIVGANWNENIEFFTILYSSQNDVPVDDLSSFQMGVKVNISD